MHNIIQTLQSIPHNSLYVKRYYKFISSCRLPEDYKDRIDKHHILPKSIWPDYKDLRSNKWNMVNLTPRQHYIAHWILAKAYGDKMWFAFHRLSHSVKEKVRISSKAYEAIQQHSAKASIRYAQEAYGVDNVFQAKSIKAKIKETNLIKYGVENPSQSEAIKQKKILTTIENYGVLHHNQLPENKKRIAERTRQTRIDESDTICEHCHTGCKTLNYKKWHGDRCKQNPNRTIIIFTCQHCKHQTDNKGMFNRWHNNNCKQKPV